MSSMVLLPLERLLPVCVSDVKLVKVKREHRDKLSSSGSSCSSEDETETKAEEEEDEHEPDLDLESDFPQGKLLHLLMITATVGRFHL